MKLKILIISASILTTAFSAFCQNVFTLEDCIVYATTHNLDILQGEVTLLQTSNNLAQAKRDLLPSISAEVSYNINWGRSVDLQELEIIRNSRTQALSASIGVSATLFDGLRAINAIKSIQSDVYIANASLDDIKGNITINVIQSYLQVLLSRQLLQDANASYEGITAQREKIAILTQAGNRPYIDLLEITAQESSERVSVTKAKGEYELSLLALRHLLHVPDSLTFEISEPEDEQCLQIPFPDIENIASMPQVRKAAFALHKRKNDLAIALGKLSPQIRLSAGFGSYYSDAAKGEIKNQFLENQNPSVGLTISIPIFDRFRTVSDIKNARLDITASQAAYSSAVLNAQKTLIETFYEAQSRLGTKEAAKESLQHAKKNFDYASQKFSLGEIPPSEYIIARTNLAKAQGEYHQAKYRYLFQLKILEYYNKLLDTKEFIY